MRAAKEDEKEDEKEKAKEKESRRSEIGFKLVPMSQRGMAGSSAKKPRPHSTSSKARRGGGSSHSSSDHLCPWREALMEDISCGDDPFPSLLAAFVSSL